MTNWTLQPNGSDAAKNVFQTLEKVLSLSGKKITHDRMSDVIYVQAGQTGYYVKRYTSAGKGVRRWFGRPRLHGEWENLQHFEQWGLPAAKLIAFGSEKAGPFFKQGAVITAELPDTEDLAELAKKSDSRLNDPKWVASISKQIAHCARVMHSKRFAHGDFKWRNILVDKGDNPKIYLIDCPDGKFWIPPFLQYRKNKDIACLDKVAKKVLSRTQRLRFYLDYLEQDCLTMQNKRHLRHILRFFKGRE